MESGSAARCSHRSRGAGSVAGRWLVCCGLAGFAFGAWMDLFTVTTFAAETSTDSYLTIATLSLPFNIAHAVGNFVLCLTFGPAFVRMLERFQPAAARAVDAVALRSRPRPSWRSRLLLAGAIGCDREHASRCATASATSSGRRTTTADSAARRAKPPASS